MAYNSYFGQYYQPYQPMQYQPVQMPQMQQQTQVQQQQSVSDDRIWVQGEIGAKAYLTIPNATVTLWDTESQTIYVKSNMNGMPTMQILSYEYAEKPKQNVQQTIDMNNYVTREEFEKRIKELTANADAE